MGLKCLAERRLSTGDEPFVWLGKGQGSYARLCRPTRHRAWNQRQQVLYRLRPKGDRRVINLPVPRDGWLHPSVVYHK